MAPNLLLPLSLLLLLVVFGSKITGRANTPFYIFVHIFSTPCGWDLSGVRLYFYIKCFIRYRIFPPTVHVRKPVDWSFTSSKSFRQYSSCDGKLPDLGFQLLWPRTFEALRDCSVFILNLAERTFYQVARVLGRVNVWKIFPSFPDCF